MEILLSIIGLLLMTIAFTFALLFNLTFIKRNVKHGTDFLYFITYTVSLFMIVMLFMLGLGLWYYHNLFAFL